VRGAIVREEQDPNIVGGLTKGLAVIEAFDDARPKLAISDIAKITGYDRAACRRLLLTLVKLGYAGHDGKFFKLKPRIMRLGFAYLKSASLPSILQPSMDDLSRTTEESCSASVLDGTQIVYIARASKQRVMSINLSVGSRLPSYCSSMGRVLLAALPPTEARALLNETTLLKLTAHTLTDVEAIMATLDAVRRQGYSLIDEELELGLRSIAVPVLNNRGQVVAAINLGAQAARVSVERMMTEFLPKLRKTQGDLRQFIAPD
jgi:IclR family pca regulon transcriptional regulator